VPVWPISPISLLVFTRTEGYRHESIPAGLEALERIARERGFGIAKSEDPTIFADEGLAPFDVVVFFSTAGVVLDGDQKRAFERFMRRGKGFVGIHSAADTEREWPFFGKLVGALFRAHPPVQPATVVVEDRDHPATRMLPPRFTHVDEWYAFARNPRPDVHVLLTLDETSFSPGDAAMGSDHPVSWTHETDGARAFYTALGHTVECYSDPLFLAHLAAGIAWAGGG
jgi:type 1 glutamine amidotransferase